MTQDPKFYNLILEVREQAAVDLPLTEAPATAIRRIFKDGESIKALSKFHRLYDESHGRIYPMFDDDEGFYDREESTIPTDDAVEAIAYAWECLVGAMSFSMFSQAYSDLQQAVSDLISWHPRYDKEWGFLR